MKELILYISDKFSDNPKFGAVKMNKLLFYCDAVAYAFIGRPITGFEYQKQVRGHVPSGILPVRDEMQRNGDVEIREVQLKSGKIQHRTVNLRNANMALFTSEEVSVINSVLDALMNHDAQSISDLSHLEIGWMAARDFETIPYGTVFVSNEPLTTKDVLNVQSFAQENGYAS